MFNTEGKKRAYKALAVALAITLFVAVLIVAPVAILVSMMFIVVDKVYLYVRDGRPIQF